MQKIKLYRFIRSDGGVTVSPAKPEVEHTELTRLVADENMVLTDGISTTTCVDTDDSSMWQEIADTSMSETEQKAFAYDILTGVAE